MSGLDIQPHSRRGVRTALVALTVVAAASFSLGVARQLAPAGPSPFPRTSLAGQQGPSAIPEATPAPTLQVAEAEVRPVRRAPQTETAAPVDISAALPTAAPAPPAAPAPAASPEVAATDTAAVAAADPAPDPEAPPT